MSRNQLRCEKCGHPLVNLQPNGRVKVCPDIRIMDIVEGGVKVWCPCGWYRVVRKDDDAPPGQRAA